MNWQLIYLIRILFDPRVTKVPLRVLRELRTQGKQRLPEIVQDELEHGARKKNALAFIREWLDGEMLSRHQGQWVLNSFLPPFPSQAYNRMFENLLSGRRLSPVSAYLATTAACPYECWHCSLQNRQSGNLSTEQWYSIIQQLLELGTSVIGFTGGEPFARPDLPELIKTAADGGAATIVFTSGALLDQEKASALQRAGLWACCVSLDHPNPKQCDQLRGIEGAYKKAIESINIAKHTGFYTMIGTVATRTVVEEKLYQKLYDVARELEVHEFRLIEPMPCGKLSGTSEEMLLMPEHVHALREFHVTTNRRGRLPKVCAFNQIESPEIFGCGGGTQHLFIDSAGAVCPCDFTPLSFGNVTTEPFTKIWDRMNTAMVNPRRHCFIQKHHRLIDKYAKGLEYPLPPEISEKICEEAGSEPFPDYFALMTGRKK